MPSFTHYLWNNQSISLPPAIANLSLAYLNPDKIVLNFAVEFTGDTHLDPVRALKINGEYVEIPDFPESPTKLVIFKKDNIDITKYVKSAPPGLANNFQVNYIVKGLARAMMTRKCGVMTAYLVVNIPDVKEKLVEKVVEKVTLGPTKFCMSCDYSMPVDSNFCPHCGVSPESFSGPDTKGCVNCKETIPARAKFCPKCGAQQPL